MMMMMVMVDDGDGDACLCRDHPCAGSGGLTCSGGSVQSTDYAFSKAFAA